MTKKLFKLMKHQSSSIVQSQNSGNQSMGYNIFQYRHAIPSI
jgi:hypothetical protein